jgi:hypothetical protein
VEYLHSHAVAAGDAIAVANWNYTGGTAGYPQTGGAVAGEDAPCGALGGGADSAASATADDVGAAADDGATDASDASTTGAATAAITADVGTGAQARARDVFDIADDPCGHARRNLRLAGICGWLARRPGRAAPRFSAVAADGRRAVLLNRLVAIHRAKTRPGRRLRYPAFLEGHAPILLPPGADG